MLIQIESLKEQQFFLIFVEIYPYLFSARPLPNKSAAILLALF